jgi:hypothetical protein
MVLGCASSSPALPDFHILQIDSMRIGYMGKHIYLSSMQAYCTITSSLILPFHIAICKMTENAPLCDFTKMKNSNLGGVERGIAIQVAFFPLQIISGLFIVTAGMFMIIHGMKSKKVRAKESRFRPRRWANWLLLLALNVQLMAVVASMTGQRVLKFGIREQVVIGMTLVISQWVAIVLNLGLLMVPVVERLIKKKKEKKNRKAPIDLGWPGPSDSYYAPKYVSSASSGGSSRTRYYDRG